MNGNFTSWLDVCYRVMTLVAWSMMLGGLFAEEQTSQLGPVTVTTSLTPDQPVIGDEIVFEMRV